ncbi:hypothetical protein YC2023_025760 [Brassica napus]
MNRPGDWNCLSCSHLNFQRRESCQRCREPRPRSITDLVSSFASRPISNAFAFNTGPDVRPGDWYCNLGNCGTHNFASRSSCFKCGAAKDESSRSAAALATVSDTKDQAHLTERRHEAHIKPTDYPLLQRSSSVLEVCGDALVVVVAEAWAALLGNLEIGFAPGCNEHNFASRSECFRCNAPKEPDTNPPY